jgi:hypothetical protein
VGSAVRAGEGRECLSVFFFVCFFVCNQNFAVFFYRVDFKLVQQRQFYSDSNKVKFFELMDVQALRNVSTSGGAPLGGATR